MLEKREQIIKKIEQLVADRKAYLEDNESLRRSVSQKDRRYDELVGNTPKLLWEWITKRFRDEN